MCVLYVPRAINNRVLKVIASDYFSVIHSLAASKDINIYASVCSSLAVNFHSRSFVLLSAYVRKVIALPNSAMFGNSKFRVNKYINECGKK